jgi:hypothetical protein
VKNSLEAVYDLDKMVFIEPPLIHYIDVVSMYINIKHSNGIDGVKLVLEFVGVTLGLANCTSDLLKWFLPNNYIMYRQCKGTAMVSNVPPVNVNLLNATH